MWRDTPAIFGCDRRSLLMFTGPKTPLLHPRSVADAANTWSPQALASLDESSLRVLDTTLEGVQR